MSDTNAHVVLFQSNKFFWRTRNSIDVTIVQYNALNVTEIISYEPSIDKEAPRIYLNSKVLVTKLDYEEIASKVGAAKQRNAPTQTAEFTSDITNQAISDYILNRLFVSEFSRDPKRFSVKLQFNFRDRDLESGGGAIDNIICEKPEALKPIAVVHHRIFAPEEITAAFKALEDAQRTLREQCNKAMEIQAETSALEELSMKERWRIPIVVARIAKNRRLSTADSRIWAAISRNMTSEEAVEKLTRTTLRPPVSRPALSGPGAHASGQSPRTAGAHTNNAPSTIIGRVFAMRSNRLFAPTVSSQNRFSAEETKTKGKPLRKYFERAHKPQAASPAHAQTARATIPNSLHKTSQRAAHTDTHPGTPVTSPATVKTAKKAHRRKHKPRHRSPTNKTAHEEQKGEDFDPDEEDENEATLVDHISAGLVSFAATLSSKFTRSAKVHSASADEADSVTQTSLTVAGGKKQVGGSLTFRETDEVVEVVKEGKEALPTHMVSQKAHQKGASADTGEGALAAAMERKQHSQSNATGGHGFEEEKSESTMGPPSPSKSRAFFGPFLASLSRKNTHPHPAPSTSPGKGLDASRNVAGDVANDPPGSQSTHSSQNSPKPSPMRSLGSLSNFFGGTLGRLMPWSAASPNNNINNQVIPVQ